MEFQKVIESRRSVRKYDPSKKVDKEIVEEILEAAILAPSWKNSQTARYYCITSEELLDTFKKECLPEFNRINVMDAPVVVVSTFVKNISGFEKTGEPTTELGNEWGAYDLGMHNQNFVLKARDLGLDTLIMGIRDTEKIREMLLISEDEMIVSVIGLGYAAKESSMPKRKSVEEIAMFF